MKRLRPFVTLLMLAYASVARAQNHGPLPDGLYAQVTIPQGVIVGELFYKQCPVTVAHYVGLVEGTLGPQKGIPFFDNARIIRVDFVIQTGETRARIPGFPDEMVPGLRHDAMGIMQMSNSGPDTNGSYWCFMLEPTPRLNYLHTVFGKVVRSLDLLPKIKVNDHIVKIEVLRVGADAQKFKVDEASFAALLASAKRYEGPREPGPDAFFDDADKILPQPTQTSRYNRARDFNFKLAKFHLFTGETLKARLFAKTPAEGAQSFVDKLATQNGIADKGVLAVYFVDTGQWTLHIAKDSRPDFIAGPRTPEGLKPPRTDVLSYEETLKQFLDETRAEGEALIAKEEKTTGQGVPDGMKLKLRTDALLDALLFRLEPPAAAVQR